jgi:hypothetical protein
MDAARHEERCPPPAAPKNDAQLPAIYIPQFHIAIKQNRETDKRRNALIQQRLSWQRKGVRSVSTDTAVIVGGG